MVVNEGRRRSCHIYSLMMIIISRFMLVVMRDRFATKCQAGPVNNF